MSNHTYSIFTTVPMLALLVGCNTSEANPSPNETDEAQQQTESTEAADDETQTAEPTDSEDQDDGDDVDSEAPTEDEVRALADEDGAEFDTAEEFAVGAAEIMTTWDLRQDNAETEASIRALGFFDEQYEEIFVVPENPMIPQDWQSGALENEAVSLPEVDLIDSYGHDPVSVRVEASWSWVSDDGWTGNGDSKVMDFQVSDEGEDFTITDWVDGGFQ